MQFDNPAENFPRKFQKFSAQSPTKFINVLILFKHFLQKNSLTRRMKFCQPCRNFLAESPTEFRW